MDSYSETRNGRLWAFCCEQVDLRALRQMLREAIGLDRMSRATDVAEVYRGEMAGLVRCVGYVIGGTGFTGYDRVAGERWRATCDEVRQALRSAPDRPWDALFIPEDVDPVLDALLPIALRLNDPESADVSV